ncbi:MAG TPA: glucokinase [Gammaproteobacteria bacterium]|nr:glucokinase [Gammaproteobacteria bacterium]
MNLIADIGATNARCALLDETGRIVRTETCLNTHFDSLESLLRRFAAGATLERGVLAVAAPISGDEITMTNVEWRFGQKALAESLGLASLRIVNDFEALAHALPRLTAENCHRIGRGESDPRATRAVLGAGSGLGVAAAVPDGAGWTAVAGEGGHVTLPTLSEAEAWLIADHGDANGHCSAERLLSGPGLVRIHSSLARRAGVAVDAITAAEITRGALAGEAIAKQTYDAFFALLGTVAGNLALTVGARGGVYIAGGVAPRVVGLLERSAFRERFIAKGRYRAYLDAIPTLVITAERPAFVGLKALLGFD